MRKSKGSIKESKGSLVESHSHSLRAHDGFGLEINGKNSDKYTNREITAQDIRSSKLREQGEIRPARTSFSHKNYQRFKNFVKNTSLKKHDV